MGGKYTILARDYDDTAWSVALYTDSRAKAFVIWVKALFRYELVDFEVRK